MILMIKTFWISKIQGFKSILNSLKIENKIRSKNILAMIILMKIMKRKKVSFILSFRN